MSWTPDLIRRYAAEVDGRLYHLTDAENLAAILREGLRPDMPSQFDAALLRPGCVYLCDRRVAGWALDGSFDASWGDCVLAVDIASLDPGRFVGDEDYWRRAPGVAGHGWRDILAAVPQIDAPRSVDASLRDGGTVAYAGPIAASQLQIAYIDPRRVDVPGLKTLVAPRRWRG